MDTVVYSYTEHKRIRRNLFGESPEVVQAIADPNRKSVMQFTPLKYPTSYLAYSAGGAAGRRRISKECVEICSENHQDSFKPSPTRIGQVTVAQLSLHE